MAGGLTRAFLGLGSNLGDRRAHLEAAVSELRAAGVSVLASSSVFETEPVGLVLDQPPFLNACLRVACEPAPLALLELVKGIEARVGRAPGGVRHGPRVLDIDILLYGSSVFESERLVVPHPALTERRFVLVPLLELDPSLALPDGSRLDAALAALGGAQDVARAGPPLL